MTSLVSIIIPVFNSEMVLTRCFDSILEQDYDAWEVIVVDDGSRDRSALICDEYASKDGRFKVVHQENYGVSVARNIALSMASGVYVCFVDSDDAVAPNYVSSLVHGLGNNDLSVCGFVRCYPDGRLVTYRPPRKAVLSFLHPDPKLFQDNLGLFNGSVSKLYKMSIIKHNFISFPDDLSFGEDTLFNYCYLEHCQSVSFISRANYYYFTNTTDTLSSNYREGRLRERQLVWRKRFDFVKRHSIDSNGVLDELYKDLWALIYDGIFSNPHPTLAGFRSLLSQPENKYPRGKESLFNAPRWIKSGIVNRRALLFLVIRIISSKRCQFPSRI